MADYTEEELDRASTIVNRLASREWTRDEDAPPIFDVQRDLVVFNDDAELASSFSEELLPALDIGNGDLVPMSLRQAADSYSYPFLEPWRRYFGLRSRTSISEYILAPSVLIHVEEARSLFLKRAKEFVATRIAGIRLFKNGEYQSETTLNVQHSLQSNATVAAPGCTFSVSTNTSGLSVHWSGAYFISWNNFGYPTTPATNVLQSGVYVFGVDGGAYTTIRQGGSKVSLPGPQTNTHLNF